MKAVFEEQALPYLRHLWRYKWLSVAIAWLICMVGWAGVVMIPPRYESSTRVYLNADQLLTPLLRGLAIDDNPARHVEYLQRTLLSRPNLEQVIRLSNLDSAIAPGDSQGKEALVRQLSQDVALEAQTANLITIRYSNRDPVVAKNVVQALLTVFSENSTGSDRKEMENAKRFISQQLQSYQEQLRAAEKRRAEFHEKYLDLLPSIDGAVSRLQAGRDAVGKLTLDVADAQSKRDALQRQLQTIPKFISVDSLAPQVIVAGQPTGAQARLEAARAKLEDLRTRFTEQYPDVVALRRQIAELEARASKEAPASGSFAPKGASPGGRKTEASNPVYEQVQVRLVEAETALASLERRLKQAQADQQVLEQRARETPSVEAQAQNLDRDYAVKKKNYEELLQRREQTGIAEAADTTADKIQFRVIDPPQVPILPSSPKQPLLLSGVFLAALGGGIALPFLLLQLDKSFHSLASLRELGAPVLGSISWQELPGARRWAKIQIAALCVSTSFLIIVYGAMLMFSAKVYGLGHI